MTGFRFIQRENRHSCDFPRDRRAALSGLHMGASEEGRYPDEPGSFRISLLRKGKMNHTGGNFLPVSSVGPLDSEPWLKVIYCICLALETAFGSIANFVVVFVIAITPSLRTVENAFVVNLAIADFCIAAVTSPSSVIGVLFGKHWYESRPVLCAVVSTLCSAGCIATNWNTTFIALNRYTLICNYSNYHRIFTPFRTFTMCLGIWIAMFLIQLPNHLGWGDTRFSEVYFVCSYATHLLSYTLFYLVTGLFVPVSVTFLAYFGIYRKVRHSRLIRNRILPRTISSSSGQSVSVPSRKEEKLFRKNVIIVKKLFASYVFYLMLMAPVGVTTLVGHAVRIPHVWYALTLTLAHGVSLTNCLMYAASLGKFWDALRGILGMRKKAGRGSEASHTSATERAKSRGVTNPSLAP